ncbi:MAG: radical SAM protein [Chitinispirillales bacterium]|jgi:wyosine [tRNA(Phe)-imidazoG37] synthetase (radical SAM superfamily)|nr:radical SAM protein [Chitinispirillales bacterium]
MAAVQNNEKNETSGFRHLFGPVRSRRLGISLGVNMIPFKTCSLDCVYCECGATTVLTTERKEYIPAGSIIAELDRYLVAKPQLDYVTFGGSGEPTLHSGLGGIINHLKRNYPQKKIAILTNSTPLSDPKLIADILPCDLIVPSLDAVSDDIFYKINRPEKSLDCAGIIKNLIALSKEFKGQIWLEIFILPGVNDTDKEIALFKEAAAAINPTRVQLNSLDRPGTCANLAVPAAARLEEIAARLAPLPVEIVSRNTK